MLKICLYYSVNQLELDAVITDLTMTQQQNNLLTIKLLFKKICLEKLQGMMNVPIILWLQVKEKTYHYVLWLYSYSWLLGGNMTQLVMHDLSYKLKLQVVNRVFRKQQFTQVVEQLCAPIAVELDIPDNIAKLAIPDLQQHNVDNLYMLQNLCARTGVKYFWDHSSNTPRLKFRNIIDSNSETAANDYNWQHDTQTTELKTKLYRLNIPSKSEQSSIASASAPTSVNNKFYVSNDTKSAANDDGIKHPNINLRFYFTDRNKQANFAADGVVALSSAKQSNSMALRSGKLIYPSCAQQLKVSGLEFLDSNGMPQTVYSLDKLTQDHKMECLPPPLQINLCSNQQVLDTKQINYLRQTGTATIFIHGYNVPVGAAPKYIDKFRLQHIDGAVGNYCALKPIFNYQHRSFLLSKTIFTKRWPQLRAHWNSLSQHHPINGTGANKWALHMEHNLNLASGNFDGIDYRKYQRIINVFWPGAVKSAIDFNKVLIPANNSGMALVPLIKQLAAAKLKINIITHSLGARVALSLLDKLVLQGYSDTVNKVVLWQPAVTSNALSDADGFFNARYAADKFIVLHSENDLVLKAVYPIAQALQYNSSYGRQYDDLPSLDTVKLQQFRARLAKLLKRTRGQCMETVLTNSCGELAAEIQDLAQQISAAYYHRAGFLPALGASGPEAETYKLFSAQQLSVYDTSAWLNQHSAMLQPSKEVFKHIYQDILFGKEQLEL